MKQVSEAKMRDVAASLAIQAADALPKEQRVQSVAAFLQCDEDEARELIARGRRLERAKAKERVG